MIKLFIILTTLGLMFPLVPIAFGFPALPFLLIIPFLYLWVGFLILVILGFEPAPMKTLFLWWPALWWDRSEWIERIERKKA